VPVPAAPRHLVELTGPRRLNDIAALTAPNEGEVAERQTITNQLKPTGDYPGRPPSVISLRCFRNRTYGEYKAMLDELGASTIATMCLPPTTAVVARSTTRRSNSEILRDTEGALARPVSTRSGHCREPATSVGPGSPGTSGRGPPGTAA
jgi:hypothetical protein